MKPYQKLQRYWQDTQSIVRVVALGQRAVEEFEQEHRILLPDDFREYVICSCPIDDSTWDADYVTWWPLSRIKSIPEEYPHDITEKAIARDVGDYFFFADYSIWCWAWAINCGNGTNRGRVAVIGRDRFVADSFAQFVDYYIEDRNQHDRLTGGVPDVS